MDSKHTYLSDLASIREKTFFSLSETSSVAEQIDYLRFKAAAMYFTGKDSLSFAPADYDAYLRNKKFTDIEFDNARDLESGHFLDVLGADKLKPERPAIYCSFHMGSYTSTISSLVTRNMNLALVLGADAYEEKSAMFEQAAQDWKASTGQLSRFVTLNGQANNAVISMVKNFKRNNNLFFFIDGNKGADAFDASSEALVEVDVHEGRILSRRGIAYLAHYLKVPIIPLVSYRPTPEKIAVKIFDEIFPEGSEAEFCQAGTRKIWAAFAEIFLAYPLQWESMAFCHQFRSKPASGPDHFDGQRSYAFNSEEYGFYFDDGPALFSYVRLEAIKLPRAYGEFLLKMAKKKISLHGLALKEFIKDGASLNKLIESKLLVAI